MQKYTVYGEQRPSSKLARKRQSKTARPKATVAAGIANMAASLSSFAIQQRTGVALEPLYLVVASSPLPICVSGLSSSSLGLPLFHLFTSQSRFRVTLTGVASSIASSWICPAFFSFTTSCYSCVTSVISSTACAWVCPIFIYYITASIWCDPSFTGVGSSSAYSWFWHSSPPTPASTSFVSSFSATSSISVSGLEGISLPSTPSGMSIYI